MKKIYLTFCCFFAMFLMAFYLPAQNFQEIAKFETPDPIEPIGFGTSISSYGNYLVVGDHIETLDVNGNNSIDNAGAAYIYEKDSNGNWKFHQKIVGSNRYYNSQFGGSVSIFEDIIVVGSELQPYDSNGGNWLGQAGAVYIFEKSSDGTWSQVQKIVASDRGGDNRFGASVAINANGILVGSPNHYEFGYNGGAAYFFQKDVNGIWQETQIFTSSDSLTGDRFGISTSIHNDYAVIGANYQNTDDQNANNKSYAGAAYVFKLDTNGTWNEVDKLVASDRTEGDRFGVDASISGDFIVISANQETETEPRECSFPCEGAAYVFENDGTDNWVEVKKLTPSDRGDYIDFGVSVHVKDNLIVVGAEYNSTDDTGNDFVNISGAVYVFARSEDGVWHETQKVVQSDRKVGGRFGYSCFIGDEEAYFTSLHYDPSAFYVFSIDNSLSDSEIGGFKNSTSIFPNPTSGNIEIDLGKYYDDVEVKLSNSLGQSLFTKTYKSKHFINLDVTEYMGLCFVKVTTRNGESATFKVIKN